MYKTGDIFHCTRNSFISKAIRFFIKSNLSHTAVLVMCWDKPFIIEAQSKGVYAIPFDEWLVKWKYTFIVTRPSIIIDEKSFALKAMSVIGHTGYDFESFLLRKPFDLATGKWRLKDNEDDKMFCSEFVAWCFNIYESYRLSPKDVYDWCIKNNFKVVA